MIGFRDVAVRSGLDSLALEDEPPPVPPGHHVAPALAACLAEMLGPLVALAPDEPQAEALVARLLYQQAA